MGNLLEVAFDIGKEYAGFIVGAAVFLAILVLFRGVVRQHTPLMPDEGPSEIERRFRNVFAMMPEAQRQSIIDHYSYKNDCGREEAMKLAMEDLARDSERW